MNRRAFLAAAAGSLCAGAAEPDATVATVLGPVPASQLGVTLTHEHVLVDFIGAAGVDAGRYNTGDVLRAALPKMNELRAAGCRSFVDCTPAFLGRDPALLRRLSEACGLHILTNTGYYGSGEGKFVPALVAVESAEQIAQRWSAEAERGIDGTGIRPAFQKIGVNKGPLGAVDRKLVEAAAICYRKTALRMHVHTGDGPAASDILEILKAAAVPASAYVWVHAQNETERSRHIEAAKQGAWVSFDAVNEQSLDAHVSAVADMASAGLLNRVLVSQDSGWYRVGEPGGGDFRGYTFLFEKFLPALRQRGFTDAQIRTLTIDNPARVFSRGEVAARAPLAAPAKKKRRRG